MELPAATQKPDKAHALLFALELLFIIRPHGAVEFLSCFVAEMLLFMELLCCKWCALLVGVRCWLSAGYQRVCVLGS